MASERELERIIVRLVGDASNYQKMLEDAQKSTSNTADGILKAAKEIERSAKDVDALTEAYQRFNIIAAQTEKLQKIASDDVRILTGSYQTLEDTLVSTLAAFKNVDTAFRKGTVKKKGIVTEYEGDEEGGVTEKQVEGETEVKATTLETAVAVGKLVGNVVSLTASVLAFKKAAVDGFTLAKDAVITLITYVKSAIDWMVKLQIGSLSAVGDAVVAAWKNLTAAIMAGVAALKTYVTWKNAANVAALGLKGAIVALVVYGLYKFAEWLWNSNKAMQEWNKQVEAIRKKSEETKDSMADMYTGFAQEAKNTAESNPDFDEEAALERILANGRREVAGMTTGIISMRRAAEEAKPTMWSLWQSGAEGAKQEKAMADAQQERLNSLEKSLAVTRTRLNEIRGDKPKQLELAFRSLQKGVDDAGLTIREKFLKSLADLGAAPWLVDIAKGMQDIIDRGHEISSAKDDLDSFIKSLERQNSVIGLGEKEARLALLTATLRGQGRDKELQQLKELIEKNEWLVRVEKTYNEIKERAKRLTEQYMDPLERYRKELEKLEQARPFISEDTFAKALKHIQDEFMSVENRALDAKEAIRSFDAAMAGSAEANKRIAQWSMQIESEKEAALRRGALPQAGPSPQESLGRIGAGLGQSILDMGQSINQMMPWNIENEQQQVERQTREQAAREMRQHEIMAERIRESAQSVGINISDNDAILAAMNVSNPEVNPPGSSVNENIDRMLEQGMRAQNQARLQNELNAARAQALAPQPQMQPFVRPGPEIAAQSINQGGNVQMNQMLQNIYNVLSDTLPGIQEATQETAEKPGIEVEQVNLED